MVEVQRYKNYHIWMNNGGSAVHKTNQKPEQFKLKLMVHQSSPQATTAIQESTTWQTAVFGMEISHSITRAVTVTIHPHTSLPCSVNVSHQPTCSTAFGRITDRDSLEPIATMLNKRRQWVMTCSCLCHTQPASASDISPYGPHIIPTFHSPHAQYRHGTAADGVAINIAISSRRQSRAAARWVVDSLRSPLMHADKVTSICALQPDEVGESGVITGH